MKTTKTNSNDCEVVEVDFTKNADKLFNQSFFDIRKAKKKFVVVYGGSGTGKSVSVHQSEIIRLLTNKHNTLVIRKHATDIKESCYALFQEQAERFNIDGCFKWRTSPFQIINPETRKKIIFRGIDDSEKIKSIVGIKRIVIEEASQLSFADFRELVRRARGIKGIQIILVLNPVDENHWIKTNLVDETGAYHDDTEVFKYLYTDNKFLTEEDIKELERLKLIDPVEYDIYVLAKWGVRDNKRSWLHSFDEKRHVKENVPFIPQFPVYLSFDFNNDPFACVAFQFSEPFGNPNSFIHFIREFTGVYKIEDMIERIQSAFPFSVFYVTGDKSGSNKDIGRHQTLYQMIQNALNITNKQMNLNTQNLEHMDSHTLCNAIFGAYPNVKIDGTLCPNLVSQCRNAKIRTEGKPEPKPKELLKDRKDNKNDEFDAMRYAFQTYFRKWINDNYLRLHKNVNIKTAA